MPGDRFIFHATWSKSIKDMPVESKAAIYDAAVSYGLEGIVPELDPVCSAAFAFIKADIDADNERLEAAAEVHRICGAKGGRPRKNQNNQNGFQESENTTDEVTTGHGQTDKNQNGSEKTKITKMVSENQNGFSKETPETHKTENKTDSKNQNGSGNQNNQNGFCSGKKVLPSPSSLSPEPQSFLTPESSLKTEKSRERIPLWGDGKESKKGTAQDVTATPFPESLSDKAAKIDYEGLMRYYNTTFAGKLPEMTKMTEQRRKAVRARVAQYGKRSIMTAFREVLQCSFLLGDNDNGWRADFDFIFQAKSFTRLLEGSYERKPARASTRSPSGQREFYNDSVQKYDNRL
ncbi:MAG: DUF6291 domain-containing protein [Bacteroidales bacterium]|jgi:hypothetical protein|nr:DUF6291 domain-containing protein [Bacteroidales bacterium]